VGSGHSPILRTLWVEALPLDRVSIIT